MNDPRPLKSTRRHKPFGGLSDMQHELKKISYNLYGPFLKSTWDMTPKFSLSESVE